MKTLRELADVATSGNWWVQSTTACSLVIQGGDRTTDARYIAMMGEDHDGEPYFRTYSPYDNADNDAEFIAAANPSVVLALLDKLDAVRAWAREVYDNADDYHAPYVFAARDVWELLGDERPTPDGDGAMKRVPRA